MPTSKPVLASVKLELFLSKELALTLLIDLFPEKERCNMIYFQTCYLPLKILPHFSFLYKHNWLWMPFHLSEFFLILKKFFFLALDKGKFICQLYKIDLPGLVIDLK